MALNWRQLKDFYLQNLKTGHFKYGIGKKYTFQADTAANISFSYIPQKRQLECVINCELFQIITFHL